MQDISTIANIYFVGAGGIGMAALERYFLAKGKKVAGYDRTRTKLTDELVAEGVKISFDESAESIPEEFRNPADTLVIYTPAVPADLPILRYFREKGFEVMKRAQALGIITRDSRSLCFAGTHGKTTTSSMAAHILQSGSVGCNAFLGGELKIDGRQSFGKLTFGGGTMAIGSRFETDSYEEIFTAKEIVGDVAVSGRYRVKAVSDDNGVSVFVRRERGTAVIVR